MDKILYKLDTFEGPLDLLLTLIQKNKVSIYDIPIVEITAQYLEAIDGIEEANLDNTSEFLVMASNLLYIKSKMLLPKNEEEEDEEDPREELARRLAEYQQFKEASKELRKSEFTTKEMVFREPEKIKFPMPEYDITHDTKELIDAFNNIFQRRVRKAKPEKRAFSKIVGREKVSVDDMVEKICKVLKHNKRVQFESLFKAAKLAVVLDTSVDEVNKAVDELKKEYSENHRGFNIIDILEGYQICSRPEYYTYIQEILGEQRRQPLSNAAMEALAIIAYKQPITKGQIEHIRGVNSDGCVNRLYERGLIEEKGRLDAPGRPILYVTTDTFLRCFGLTKPTDLPPLDLRSLNLETSQGLQLEIDENGENIVAENEENTEQ